MVAARLSRRATWPSASGAAAEVALPQRVTDQPHPGIEAGRFLVGGEQPAVRGAGAQQRERAGRQQPDRDGDRDIPIEQRFADAAHPDDRRERARLAADVEEVGHAIRSADLAAVATERVVLQPVDAGLVRDRQRPQQGGVDDVEQRAAGGNPDGERGHERRREAPIGTDEAEGKPEVGGEAGERHAVYIRRIAAGGRRERRRSARFRGWVV